MAGAVCHELNQPLHVVSGYADMLLSDLDSGNPHAEWLRMIKEQIERMAELTRKIMHVTQYRTKDYLGGRCKIVDIEEASLPRGTGRRKIARERTVNVQQADINRG